MIHQKSFRIHQLHLWGSEVHHQKWTLDLVHPPWDLVGSGCLVEPDPTSSWIMNDYDPQ